MYINSDLEKLRDSSVKFLQLQKQYNDIVDKFFARINNIPVKTNEFSESETAFFTSVNKYRKDFDNMAVALKKYGDLMYKLSEDLTNKINIYRNM